MSLLTPWSLCNKLLSQAELTLNLLRQSNATPKVLAHAHLFSNVDYNRRLLAPLGYTVHIYEDTDKRRTGAPHTVDGWYLGTSPDHYHAHIIQVKSMQSERVSETVFFKHKYLTNPSVSYTDKVIAAAKALHTALVNKRQGNNNPTMQALQSLVKIFVDTAQGNSSTSRKEDTDEPASKLMTSPPSKQLITRASPLAVFASAQQQKSLSRVPRLASSQRVDTSAPPVAPTTPTAPAPAVRAIREVGA